MEKEKLAMLIATTKQELSLWNKLARTQRTYYGETEDFILDKIDYLKGLIKEWTLELKSL